MTELKKLAIKRLEDEIRRDIINALFQNYRVPKSLREAFWRAYNAAHSEGVKTA